MVGSNTDIWLEFCGRVGWETKCPVFITVMRERARKPAIEWPLIKGTL